MTTPTVPLRTIQAELPPFVLSPASAAAYRIKDEVLEYVTLEIDGSFEKEEGTQEDNWSEVDPLAVGGGDEPFTLELRRVIRALGYDDDEVLTRMERWIPRKQPQGPPVAAGNK